MAVTYVTNEYTFTGTDSFTYKVNDGKADSNVSTVSITIDEVSYFGITYLTDDTDTTI
jgi:Big-like domain-containing protein